jgi:hypothetical protein
MMDQASLYRAASRMRQITAEHYAPPKGSTGEVPMRKVTKRLADGEETTVEVPDTDVPRGRWSDPRHIGMRRHAGMSGEHLVDTLERDTETEAV